MVTHPWTGAFHLDAVGERWWPSDFMLHQDGDIPATFSTIPGELDLAKLRVDAPYWVICVIGRMGNLLTSCSLQWMIENLRRGTYQFVWRALM